MYIQGLVSITGSSNKGCDGLMVKGWTAGAAGQAAYSMPAYGETLPPPPSTYRTKIKFF